MTPLDYVILYWCLYEANYKTNPITCSVSRFITVGVDTYYSICHKRMRDKKDSRQNIGYIHID